MKVVKSLAVMALLGMVTAADIKKSATPLRTQTVKKAARLA